MFGEKKKGVEKTNIQCKWRCPLEETRMQNKTKTTERKKKLQNKSQLIPFASWLCGYFDGWFF